MSIAQSCMKQATGQANDNGIDDYKPPKARKKANTENAEKVNNSNTRAHEDIAPGEFAIREDKRNYRKHSEQNLKLIGNSLKAYGAGRSIVADNSGAVIGGNGTLRQANKLGIKQRIVHTTGDELVVVVRDDIAPDDPRRQELAIMDNSTTDSSEFNFDLLQADFSVPELEAFGVIVPEVEIADNNSCVEGETDPDAVPETSEEPKSKRGEVYQLGKHRLMCGDSTSADDVALLMNGEKADMVFTDPPYGVSANGGRGDTKRKLNMRDIENDDLRGDNLFDFLFSALNIMPSKSGASIYVCYPWATQEEFTKAIKKCGYNILNCIIWRKNVFGLNGFRGYRPQYEMIYFCCKDDYAWYGDLAQSNVWDFNREIKRSEQGNHPTPKPIDLIIKAIKNSSKNEDIVFDNFGGSGSTLIACEQTSRQCRMMELDEHYCDVIRKRWAEFVHGEGCDWEKLTEVC